MSEMSILAIDLAKNSFQGCGVRADGVVVFNRAVSRGRLVQLLSDQSPCVVAIEVCATSHHWGRVAAVALANKMTRMVWAMTTKGEDYRMA